MTNWNTCFPWVATKSRVIFTAARCHPGRRRSFCGGRGKRGWRLGGRRRTARDLVKKANRERTPPGAGGKFRKKKKPACAVVVLVGR